MNVFDEGNGLNKKAQTTVTSAATEAKNYLLAGSFLALWLPGDLDQNR
jgi:hypothetical protein